MRVAILGCGTMGAGMARSMVRAGLDVVAWNRTSGRARDLVDDGVVPVDSVAEAVRGAAAVITMLYDADSVLDVTDELSAALDDTAVWLQCSTVGPDGMARIAARAGTAGLLDVPVLGTKQPAEQGTLVALVSGPAALVDFARPVLDAIGSRTVAAGTELGKASALKLACNAWVLSITAAAAQSLALARALGVDGQLFLAAIEGGGADSPYAHIKGKAMLAGEYPAAFSLDGGRKDLELIASAAHPTGLPGDLLDGVRALFDAASQAGHGADDLAAVFTAFER
ncbi:MAG: NAD(P)-dependent oxidoreductase [Jatrophihabitans sp.]